MENFEIAQAEYEHQLDCPYDEVCNYDDEDRAEALIDESYLHYGLEEETKTEKQQEIIISIENEYIDYNAPWGTATHLNVRYNGFSIDWAVGIDSFCSFGDYSYLSDYKKDIKTMINLIDCIILEDYHPTDNNSSPEKIEDFMEKMREIALRKAA